MEDPVDVARNEDYTPNETVLEFWQRREHEDDYRILLNYVGVPFSIPSSSCQIERDLRVIGKMVSTQRTTLAEHDIDMCAYLNRNSDLRTYCSVRRSKNDSIACTHLPASPSPSTKKWSMT